MLESDYVPCYIESAPDGGVSETVVFLHGLMMTKEVWRHQLSAFGGRFRSIALDLAGFGEARGAGLRETYDAHADDLARFIDHHALGKVHLVGWSMGASISICFASKFPSYLSTLTLVNGSPRVTSTEDFAFGISEESALSMVESMRQQPDLTAGALADQMVEISASEESRDEVFKIISNEDPVAGAHHLLLGISTDLRSRLQTVTVPTLVCHGEEDPFSPKGVNEYMVQELIDAVLVPISGAAHLPFLTKADKFNRILERFLQR